MATAITVTNAEGSILTAIDAALTGAQITGVAVFKQVTMATSEDQASEAQYKGDQPAVIIIVGSGSEVKLVDGAVGCVLDITLLITSKTNSGVDETTRVTEAMRLMNAAKNAIEAAPPAGAVGFGDETEYHAKGAVWGETSFDDDERQPWIALRLPVSFAFGITSKTGH